MCRSNLCELIHYVPYSAFLRLDRQNLGYLTISHLNSFFISTGIPISPNDLNLILKCIDMDKDNKLTFGEFNEAFLVRFNERLR